MNTKERFLVTVNRELGSGGRTVGRKLAERLGVRFYDKVQLEGLVKEYEMSEEQIELLKARKRNWWTEICDKISRAPGADFYRPDEKGIPELVTSDDLFRSESRILREIAAEESCVVAGRAAFFVLKAHPNSLRILIRASMASRMERVMRKQGLTEEAAASVIEKVDAGRENYTKKFAGVSRYDTRNYDLVLNMDGLTEDDAVDLIMQYIERSEK
ncbi:MAG: cytidylate kinase-like family protein [Bacteroidales bacterium]|nr:cytidylate kinase-like family protein [Bacteroidales bacterium]